MTTYYDFQPSTQSVFSFSPTLDGSQYSAILTWCLFGKRYYINIYALDGTLIVSKALVGSPVGAALESLSWSLGVVTATTVEPHGYAVGATVDLTVAGCAPDAYNGQVQALVTGAATLTWPLAANPGPSTALGGVSYDTNLLAGYFDTSTMVFRTPNSQFEVSP